MPAKNVREMSDSKKRHYSLSARTFKITMVGAVMIGLAALFVGLAFYWVSITKHFINDAFNLSEQTENVLSRYVDTEKFSSKVMSVYVTMKQAERNKVGTNEYYNHYSYMERSAEYQQIKSLLKHFYKHSNVDDIFIGVYDVSTHALVYVADADDESENYCPMGHWERVSDKELKAFTEWSGDERVSCVNYSKKYGWLITSGVPIYDPNNQVSGFVLTDISLSDTFRRMGMYFFQYALVLGTIVTLFAFHISRQMRRNLVDPINKIANAAASYVDDRRKGLNDVEHFSKINIRSGDEINNLCLVMANMEKDLADYEEDITRATAEKERMGTELALANRIQVDMLPNNFPAFPDRHDFDIYASMDPAREVGGDFYDFFLLDDDHLALVMADVSGKGIPAALFMMISKVVIQNATMTGLSPQDVLRDCNDYITRNNQEEMFVTVWLGILDLKTGVLTAANAGHEYPVLTKNSRFELIHDKHGFVMGGMPGMKYKEYELQLQKGDKLFVYTDGLPEAINEAEELFGTERMVEALNKVKDGTPKEILDAVTATIDEFVGDAPQFDDLTMMCLHYIGKETEDPMNQITVDAIVKNVDIVTEFVNAELEKFDCPMKTEMQINVAIDEVFGNIAQYAYPGGDGQATIRFAVEEDPLTAVITFIDSGIPYNPLNAETPDVTLSVEERNIGGLGIYLVRKTMDDVSYEYKDGQNILTLRKKF